MAARARVVLADLQASLRDLQRQVRENGPGLAARVIRPKSLAKFDDGTTRTSQVIALFFVGPVIVVNFALLTVFHNLMADILGGGTWSADNPQTGLFQWLVTAITLGAFMLSAWAWFQFVRTSGFGYFSWNDGHDKHRRPH